jgi:hypothetical protein
MLRRLFSAARFKRISPILLVVVVRPRLRMSARIEEGSVENAIAQRFACTNHRKRPRTRDDDEDDSKPLA